LGQHGYHYLTSYLDHWRGDPERAWMHGMLKWQRRLLQEESRSMCRSVLICEAGVG
jgi:hypothetical protein